MNAFEITTAVHTLAQAIAGALDTDELVIVAALFTQLGDTLDAVAAIRTASQEQAAVCNPPALFHRQV